MKIPREARKTARELFSLAFRNGQLDLDTVRQIANSLLSEKPRFFFPILQQFTRLVRLEIQRHHATIETAYPLPPQTQKSICSLLSKRFGTQTTFEFRPNPSLIGGLRLQLGSDVWDGSILARLESLRSSQLPTSNS
ncbi:MAG: F0F1 ATP synthase subunit delta [Chthoniobacterales bacterium]|nr:F0F1 ATP synthase subunit delta [Chthoniobacterales bacterium]